MHDFYGMTEKFGALKDDPYLLKKLLEFRFDFIMEELIEGSRDAKSGEDVVDALIDICVVAIGTLHAFGVDGQKAWDEVLKANMAKAPGVKPERPNPFGLPDLIKPEGWVGPSHEGNHGTLDRIAYGSPCEV